MKKLFDNAQEMIDSSKSTKHIIFTFDDENPIIKAAKENNWSALLHLLIFPSINIMKSLQILDSAARISPENSHTKMRIYLYQLGIVIASEVMKESQKDPNLLIFFNQKA